MKFTPRRLQQPAITITIKGFSVRLIGDLSIGGALNESRLKETKSNVKALAKQEILGWRECELCMREASRASQTGSMDA